MKHHKSVEICQFSERQFSESSTPAQTQNPLFKHSSDGSEFAAYSSFVYKKPNLTQMKQEFKYLRAQWHDQTKIVDGSRVF